LLPKISIITPSLNQGAFLEQTILSVLNQNYPNLEYIVIDGGSHDDSVEIIKKYEKHLFYWVSEPDNGQANAINKGLKLASGEIVTWLNSDDYYVDNALSVVASYYMENPFEFLAGSVNMVDEDGNFLRTNSSSWPELQEGFFNNKVNIPQPGSFFTKSLIYKIGLLDENFHYAMDFDFWVRARLNDIEMKMVPDVFTNFRVHDNSKSSEGGMKFTLEILNKYLKINNLFNHDIKKMNAHYLDVIMFSDNLNNSIKIKFLPHYFLLRPKLTLHKIKTWLIG